MPASKKSTSAKSRAKRAPKTAAAATPAPAPEPVVVAPPEPAPEPVSTATIYKERNAPNEISKMVLMGDVQSKVCVIVDDIIDTAGTACKAASVLKENGATKIFMFASHGILSGPAKERINESCFDKVIISNTLNQENKNLGEKIDVMDISWMCAEAMRRSLFGESLKELYDKNIEDSNYR